MRIRVTQKMCQHCRLTGITIDLCFGVVLYIVQYMNEFVSISPDLASQMAQYIMGNVSLTLHEKYVCVCV